MTSQNGQSVSWAIIWRDTSAASPPQTVPVKSVTRIGRDPSNDIRLSDERVAKFHLYIVRDQQRITVRDLGTNSGTWRGAEQLRRQQDVDWLPDQVLTVGPYELRLVQEHAESKTTPTVAKTPEYPDISPDQMVSVSFERRAKQLVLRPGVPETIKVQFSNTTTTIQDAVIKLDSQLPDLQNIKYTKRASLPVGEIELTFEALLPRAATTTAGSYRVRIEVTSPEDNFPLAVSDATWSVYVFREAPRLSIHPGINTGRQRAQFDISLTNPMNAPTICTLEVVPNDVTDDAVYTLPEDRKRFRLAPGETAVIALEAEATNLARRQQRNHHFAVEARVPGQDVAKTQAQFIQPITRWWLRPALLAIIVGCAVATVLLFGSYWDIIRQREAQARCRANLPIPLPEPQQGPPSSLRPECRDSYAANIAVAQTQQAFDVRVATAAMAVAGPLQIALNQTATVVANTDAISSSLKAAAVTITAQAQQIVAVGQTAVAQGTVAAAQTATVVQQQSAAAAVAATALQQHVVETVTADQARQTAAVAPIAALAAAVTQQAAANAQATSVASGAKQAAAAETSVAAAATSAAAATQQAINTKPAKIRFSTQPRDTGVNVVFDRPISVIVTDQSGNPTSETGLIVRIRLDPKPQQLSGTLDIAVVNGVATFSDLKVKGSSSPTRYYLYATVIGRPELGQAKSNAFSVPAATGTKSTP